MASDENKQPDYTYFIIIFNAVISLLTLIINAHQSYSSNQCKSECMGKPCFDCIETKTMFDSSDV